MSPTRTGALGALGLLAVIGLIDAARGGHWDLFTLFVLSLAVTLSLVAGATGRRRQISVRADLWRWLSQRSATTGEPAETIADRSLARLRDQIEADAEPHR